MKALLKIDIKEKNRYKMKYTYFFFIKKNLEKLI